MSCQVFRLLAGPSFTPTAVRLRHQALTAADEYDRYFGCPVAFEAVSYGFSVVAAVLARPLDADSAVHAVVEEYLDTVAVPHATSTVESVRRLVRTMVPTGGLTLDLVCGQLAVHPRTLQRSWPSGARRSPRSWTRYAAREAERSPCESEMPLAHLAGVLGLSEQSAITRACRRWFARTPSQVRAGARS